MEPESEQLPQDRWYWGWYAIFGLLAFGSPFIPAPFGFPCFVIGVGGLLIQMREGFKARFARLKQLRISRAHLLALVRIAAVIMLIVLAIKTISLVFEINKDFDAYIVPRTVTAEQADKLKDYLSKREPFAVSVDVVPNDQEAMEYASRLFNALVQTNWDINPPNHSGPGYIQIPRLRRPKINDVGSDGKPLYSDTAAYLEAHDQWLESEIDRTIAERTYPDVGLSIQVEEVGQPTNPDPKHPRPDAILQEAMRYAGIEVNGGGGSANKEKYSVTLRVGHRPQQLGGSSFKQSIFFRVGRWIMDLGR
jgi:hypothetical protein